MSKKICIVGRGPSWTRIKEIPDDYDILMFINNPSEKIFDDPEILDLVKSKEVVIFSNMPQRTIAFSERMLNTLNVKKCVVSRLSPDWELWHEHKSKQKRSCPAWKQLSHLPPLEEDEPYLYIWRGPAGTNLEKMYTPGGRLIEHMPDETEKYLCSIYGDKMICGCSIYASLYAIIKLKVEHIYYCGVDFYHDLKISKRSFVESPTYYSGQDWWDLRVKTEGEHLKILYDKYMPQFFKNVVFEFYTDANYNPTSKTVISHPSGKEVMYKHYGNDYYVA